MENDLPGDEVPPPKCRVKEKDNLHPSIGGQRRGTRGLQFSGPSRAAAPRLQHRPGEGRSLADKGVGDVMRDATPEG